MENILSRPLVTFDDVVDLMISTIGKREILSITTSSFSPLGSGP